MEMKTVLHTNSLRVAKLLRAGGGEVELYGVKNVPTGLRTKGKALLVVRGKGRRPVRKVVTVLKTVKSEENARNLTVLVA